MDIHRKERNGDARYIQYLLLRYWIGVGGGAMSGSWGGGGGPLERQPCYPDRARKPACTQHVHKTCTHTHTHTRRARTHTQDVHAHTHTHTHTEDAVQSVTAFLIFFEGW
ncbi:unnamed protein product [Arctogadus glacialis]